MSDVKQLRDISRAENGLRSRASKQEKENQKGLKMPGQPGKGATGHLSTSSSDRYDAKNDLGCSRHGSENRSGVEEHIQDFNKLEGSKKLGRLHKRGEAVKPEAVENAHQRDLRSSSQCITAGADCADFPDYFLEQLKEFAKGSSAEALRKAASAKPDKDGVLWAKCFYVAKNAGVSLSPNDRASRQALTEAINKAFPQHYQDFVCVDGANLLVIMMTTDGEQKVFAPGKDEGWSDMAPKASRMYVWPIVSSVIE
eukprot:jgi/Botrbrau1/9018/Bobra.0148s0118.1